MSSIYSATVANEFSFVLVSGILFLYLNMYLTLELIFLIFIKGCPWILNGFDFL